MKQPDQLDVGTKMDVARHRLIKRDIFLHTGKMSRLYAL